MNSSRLEEVIRTFIPLSNQTSRGWNRVLCKVCDDHGKKGKRGGFKFDPDGTIAYNCFNCGHVAKFEPTSDHLSANMVTVLRSFGVDESEINAVNFELFKNKKSLTLANGVSQPEPILKIEPPSISIPNSFYYIKDADKNDKWAMVAREYLLLDRGIQVDSYPFMLSKFQTLPELQIWNKRLIIPIFKDSNVVFYIGRDLTDKSPKKYISPPIPKNSILTDYSQLHKNLSSPLFIVEGWFDAFVIDGVAILGNKFSQEQIAWLNRSPRKKIYIPDKWGNGIEAAKQALNHGWSISTPDIGSGCKDMNDAVMKYGKTYVIKTIIDNTYEGFEAHVHLGLYCEQETSIKKTKKTY